MTDHQHRGAAVLQRAQVPGQPVDGLDVEVVGGLVQHQQVVTAEHQRDQRGPAPLAAAQQADLAVQVDRPEQVLDQGPGPRVGGPHVIGLAADDHVPDGRLRREVVGLVQVADRRGRRPHHPAGVGFVDAGQDPQQRRLAGTVATDHADHVAGRDPETDLVQHEPGAVLHTHALGVDNVNHASPRERPRAGAPGSVSDRQVSRHAFRSDERRREDSSRRARSEQRVRTTEPTCRASPAGRP